MHTMPSFISQKQRWDLHWRPGIPFSEGTGIY
uniref:Uncharacterized protein n=1 Tax=Anguilla anguilla TaxID=7936 RepID=A0A0E9RHB0_ANGAN